MITYTPAVTLDLTRLATGLLPGRAVHALLAALDEEQVSLLAPLFGPESMLGTLSVGRWSSEESRFGFTWSVTALNGDFSSCAFWWDSATGKPDLDCLLGEGATLSAI